jgi:hypothetical protein
MLCAVSKQQVSRLMQRGHLHAISRESENAFSSFRFPELSQSI